MTQGSDQRSPGQDASDGGDDQVVRFGPGIQPSDQVAASWREGRTPPPAPPPRRGRKLLRSLVGTLITAAIAVAVVLWLLRGQGGDLEVTGIKVQVPQRTQGCDSTVEITGVLTTNGEAGRITYRWIRSDGHDSGVLHESVEKDKHDVTVHLSWLIKGPGARRFTATLELVEPASSAGKASSAFGYSCR